MSTPHQEVSQHTSGTRKHQRKRHPRPSCWSQSSESDCDQHPPRRSAASPSPGTPRPHRSRCSRCEPGSCRSAARACRRGRGACRGTRPARRRQESHTGRGRTGRRGWRRRRGTARRRQGCRREPRPRTRRSPPECRRSYAAVGARSRRSRRPRRRSRTGRRRSAPRGSFDHDRPGRAAPTGPRRGRALT